MVIKTPDDWPLSIVPIETIEKSRFIGTGFLMNFYTMPLLITNKHVIKNEPLQYRLNLPGHRIDRIKIGQEEGYEDFFKWVPHPDKKVDLAATLVPYELHAKVIGLNFELIGKSSDIYDGLDIFYWGFPLGAGAEESHHHYPILRTGVVAQNRSRNQYLIEANIFPGSSGSPIFTKSMIIRQNINIDYEVRDQETKLRLLFKAPRLIGIVSSYIPYQDTAFSSQTGRPRVVFQENSGLALAINAHWFLILLTLKNLGTKLNP